MRFSEKQRLKTKIGTSMSWRFKQRQQSGRRVAVAVTLALMIIEMMFFDLSMNYGYYLIIMSAAAGLWIYKAIKLRRRNNIIIAVMFTVISVYSAIMAIMNLIG